ncbi:MAG: hypothetical protein HFI96_06355 [Lachnospiraceae bacterium]|nr:hypothetical protein [Lachnospiraceae bacterium]
MEMTCRYKKKRLVIFVFYDKDGIVDNYVRYYIKSLTEVADRFIIISNSILDKKNRDLLMDYTQEVYVRGNQGFDMGAYKYALENILDLNEINTYDEIVLSNDTCYGPIVPFSYIFAKMETKAVDFWGIDYQENGPFSCLTSNFLVFRKTVVPELITYFAGKVNKNELFIENVYAVFECGLFNHLVSLGYKMGYYMSDNNLYIYKSPNYRIRDCGEPFIKKKCFDPRYYEKDNCIAALKYIEKNTEYDMKNIFENIKRLYGIEYDWINEKKRTLDEKKFLFDAVDCTTKEIEVFCRNNKKIYVYGMGIWAHIFLNRFRDIVQDFQGFIISDQETINKQTKEKVIRQSEMTEDMAVVVALGRKNTQEVKSFLEQKNILFLRSI